jgi:hypothetical protein
VGSEGRARHGCRGGRSKRRPWQQDQHGGGRRSSKMVQIVRSHCSPRFSGLEARPTLTESIPHNARRSFDLRSLPPQLAPPSRAAFFRLFRDAHTHSASAPPTRLVAPARLGASASRRVFFFCRFRESAFARTLAKPSSLRLASRSE